MLVQYIDKFLECGIPQEQTPTVVGYDHRGIRQATVVGYDH